MFTKSVKKKLRKDGIILTAVDGERGQDDVPRQPDITHTGGLSFAKADAGLTLTDFVFDLQTGLSM